MFIALGGGAYAFSRGEVKSKHIATNAVKSKHIRNGQVRNPDLRGSAVTAGKLADGAVNSAKVEDASLSDTEVGDASLTGDDVADDSLAGADVDESSLEGVDAATLDGRPRTDYVFRSFISSPANRRRAMIFYAYTLITPAGRLSIHRRDQTPVSRTAIRRVAAFAPRGRTESVQGRPR